MRTALTLILLVSPSPRHPVRRLYVCIISAIHLIYMAHPATSTNRESSLSRPPYYCSRATRNKCAPAAANTPLDFFVFPTPRRTRSMPRRPRHGVLSPFSGGQCFLLVQRLFLSSAHATPPPAHSRHHRFHGRTTELQAHRVYFYIIILSSCWYY